MFLKSIYIYIYIYIYIWSSLCCFILFFFTVLRTNLFLSAPKEHIEDIQREKFSEDLYHAVKYLSVELYAKDGHSKK